MILAMKACEFCLLYRASPKPFFLLGGTWGTNNARLLEDEFGTVTMSTVSHGDSRSRVSHARILFKIQKRGN